MWDGTWSDHLPYSLTQVKGPPHSARDPTVTLENSRLPGEWLKKLQRGKGVVPLQAVSEFLHTVRRLVFLMYSLLSTCCSRANLTVTFFWHSKAWKRDFSRGGSLAVRWISVLRWHVFFWHKQHLADVCSNTKVQSPEAEDYWINTALLIISIPIVIVNTILENIVASE